MINVPANGNGLLNLLIARNVSEITNRAAPKINKTAVSKAILLYCQIAIVSIVQMMRAYTNTGIFSSPSVGHNM